MYIGPAMLLWLFVQRRFYTCTFWYKYTHHFLISDYILFFFLTESRCSFLICCMMKPQLTFHRAQKQTREFQRVLEEDPPSLITTNTRIKFTSDILEPAFEWDRVRRSAAPSPEPLPGNGSHELGGSMLGMQLNTKDYFIYPC